MQLFVDDGNHMHESERNACTSYDYPDESNPVSQVRCSWCQTNLIAAAFLESQFNVLMARVPASVG